MRHTPPIFVDFHFSRIRSVTSLTSRSKNPKPISVAPLKSEVNGFGSGVIQSRLLTCQVRFNFRNIRVSTITVSESRVETIWRLGPVEYLEGYNLSRLKVQLQPWPVVPPVVGLFVSRSDRSPG